MGWDRCGPVPIHAPTPQRRADDPGAHNEPDGGEGADTLADLDEQDQLDDRHGDEEKEQASHGRVMSVYAAFERAVTDRSMQAKGILNGLVSLRRSLPV